MRFLLTLFLLLILASPSWAWRTAPGIKAGIIDDEPATQLHLDLAANKLHVQPRFLVWVPENEPGIWELGLDAYWHLLPCTGPSVYIGGGLGAEFLPDLPKRHVAVPAAEAIDPPSPIGVIAAGLRFPGEYVDLVLEGRRTFSHWRDRNGVFVGLNFHSN